METMTTEQLAAAWVAVKATEKAAQQERVEIEAALIAALGGAKEEGSSTHDLASGLKVTVTGKITYKTDMAELLQLVDKLPEHLRPIKTVTTLDDTGAKYLRNNEPELWRLIASAVTISPAKTALTIKEP